MKDYEEDIDKDDLEIFSKIHDPSKLENLRVGGLNNNRLVPMKNSNLNLPPLDKIKIQPLSRLPSKLQDEQIKKSISTPETLLKTPLTQETPTKTQPASQVPLKEVEKKDPLKKIPEPPTALPIKEKEQIKIPERKITKADLKKYPSLKLKSERDIAMDFAQKVYQRFDKMIKSIILFGSSIKHTEIAGSDIDIILIVDDATMKFDEKTIAWYREELSKIIANSPYKRDLHINTVKLTTWWTDLYRGDPVLMNVLRYGESLIDFGGFFNPLKILLEEGKIKSTPEAIYNCLSRVPVHILRSKQSQMGSIEGCYWAMVDCSQALLMARGVTPPSPEHIPILLKEHFVDVKLLDLKYVIDFRDLHDLHRKIMHGNLRDIDGKVVDTWQNKAEKFLEETLKIIKKII
jgi:uncharacterized protein (UPF0332 family)/predicted nucleotidyltransferase